MYTTYIVSIYLTIIMSALQRLIDSKEPVAAHNIQQLQLAIHDAFNKEKFADVQTGLNRIRRSFRADQIRKMPTNVHFSSKDYVFVP